MKNYIILNALIKLCSICRSNCFLFCFVGLTPCVARGFDRVDVTANELHFFFLSMSSIQFLIHSLYSSEWPDWSDLYHYYCLFFPTFFVSPQDLITAFLLWRDDRLDANTESLNAKAGLCHFFFGRVLWKLSELGVAKKKKKILSHWCIRVWKLFSL